KLVELLDYLVSLGKDLVNGFDESLALVLDVAGRGGGYAEEWHLRLPGTRMEIWRLLDEQLRTRSAGRRTRRMCIGGSLEFLLRDPEVLSRHPVTLLVVIRDVPERDPDQLELDRGALQAGDYLVEILAVFGVEQALRSEERRVGKEWARDGQRSARDN